MTNRERLDPNFAVAQPGSDLLWYDALALPAAGQGWRREQLAAPWGAGSRLPTGPTCTAGALRTGAQGGCTGGSPRSDQKAPGGDYLRRR